MIVTNALLEAALTYARRGWAVLPINTPNLATGFCSCGKKLGGRKEEAECKAKHPRNWNGSTGATTDETQIREWWTKWPDAGIGIATGAASNLVVVDRDDRHGGNESLAAFIAKHGQLPVTVEGLSGGGGGHYYFLRPPHTAISNSVGMLSPGIDVLGEGGYIVAAPSLHMSGRKYEWEASHHPDDVSVAALPDWLFKATMAIAGARNVSGRHGKTEPLPDRIPEGQRHGVLFKLACSMRGKGHDEDEILNVLREINSNGRVDPSLPDGEVLKLAADVVARYEPGRSIAHEADQDAALEAAKTRWTPEKIAGVDITGLVELVMSAEGISDFALMKVRDPGGFARAKQVVKARVKSSISWRDWFAAVKGAAKRVARRVPEPDDMGRNEIRCGPRTWLTAQAAEIALGQHSHLGVYWRDGNTGLARVIQHKKQPGDLIEREDGAPLITGVGTTVLQSMLTEAAAFFCENKDGESYEVTCPDAVAKVVSGFGEWPNLRQLVGVTTSPTMRADGTIIEASGYDKVTGLFAAFNEGEFPPVSSAPTLADAKAALEQLAEPFSEFCFVDKRADLSAALACVLTLIGRPAIRGNTPLFPWRATAQRSGKTLGVQVVSCIATGRLAASMMDCEYDDEYRKRFLAVGLAGDPLLLIDNVMGKLGNGQLAAVITSGAITDRILQESREVRVPWRTVIFATGNNLQLVGDLPDRAVPIDLDPQVERPEERRIERLEPLLDFVLKERPRFVWAALTALRAHAVAGYPMDPSLPNFGGFESWSRIVRGCLTWCGWPDPNLTRERIKADSDPEKEHLARFLIAWQTCLGSGGHTVNEALKKAKEPGATDLAEALQGMDGRLSGDKQPSARTVGNWIKNRRGRLVGGRKIVSNGQDRNGAALWEVKGAGAAGSAGSTPDLPKVPIFNPAAGTEWDFPATEGQTENSSPQTPQTPTDTRDMWSE